MWRGSVKPAVVYVVSLYCEGLVSSCLYQCFLSLWGAVMQVGCSLKKKSCFLKALLSWLIWRVQTNESQPGVRLLSSSADLKN